MSESARQGSAHQSVMHNFSSESYRKKRQDDTVSIRKQRREEQHLARRQRTVALAQSPTGTSPAPTPVPDPELQPLAAMAVPGVDALTDESAVFAALTSPDPEKQLQATTRLRMVLSSSLYILFFLSFLSMCALCGVVVCSFAFHFFDVRRSCSGTDPPIDQVISLNCLPYLIRFLSSPNIKLQFEAAWTLTNSLCFHPTPTTLLTHFVDTNMTWHAQNSCEWDE